MTDIDQWLEEENKRGAKARKKNMEKRDRRKATGPKTKAGKRVLF